MPEKSEDPQFGEVVALSLLVSATRSMDNVCICLYPCETPLGTLHAVLVPPTYGTWNSGSRSGLEALPYGGRLEAGILRPGEKIV